MTSPTLPKLIFGSATIAANSGFPTIERLEELLEVLWQEGVMSIDTAQICDDTETMLGQANAASRFSIDTKHCGGIIPGESTCLRIISRAEECLSRLKVKKVSLINLGESWNMFIVIHLVDIEEEGGER